MAEYFVIHTGGLSSSTFNLYPFNDGGIYPLMEVSGVAHNMAPGESVRALIIPHGHGLTDTQISGYLVSKQYDNSQGIFGVECENPTGIDKLLTFPKIKITDRTYENTRFDLYWLQTLDNLNSFGSSDALCYSYPHNIQANEVIISGAYKNTDVIRYRVYWNPITNQDVSYSGGANPYWVTLSYQDYDYYSTSPSGWSPAGTFFPSGAVTSGIIVDAPFYDERTGQPAKYTLSLSNCVVYDKRNPINNTTSFLNINLDQSQMKDTFFVDLDSKVSDVVSVDNIRKIENDDIEIPAGTIPRERLSIGIDDISIQQNSYFKGGVYISNSFVFDFNIYTFSLRTNEFIPKYEGNIDVSKLVQYYVEFNNNEWIRISPINRSTEKIGEEVIPKLIILDKVLLADSSNSEVKYLDLSSGVNSLRIKIVFDLNDIKDNNFIPPEIRDYKIIVFDKNQFFNIEA